MRINKGAARSNTYSVVCTINPMTSEEAGIKGESCFNGSLRAEWYSLLRASHGENYTHTEDNYHTT